MQTGAAAIQVDSLSKCYHIYAKPQDRLKQMLSFGHRRFYREFWAVRDVSARVGHGEAVAVIGRNGSGKSTLLQMVCGTLHPTAGTVDIDGRIAALLELGSGFNKEFTGRDNVYVNGAILGLSRKEIDERFDEIAAFADIGQFLDQPVKTYSSGMGVRLAFAVSICVQPDILVVDEALAVGDEAFQRKCFSRIEAFRERGGTLVFVSHAPQTIMRLCDRALLMDRGELLADGTPKEVLAEYHRYLNAPVESREQVRARIKARRFDTEGKPAQSAAKPGVAPKPPEEDAFYDASLVPTSTVAYESQGARITDPHITTLDGRRVNTLLRRHEYIYSYRVDFTEASHNVRFGMHIKTINGIELGGGNSGRLSRLTKDIAPGTSVQVKFRFRCLLRPKVYFLNAGVSAEVEGVRTFLDRRLDAYMFRVQAEEEFIDHGIVDFYVEPELKISQPDAVATETQVVDRS